MIFIRPGSYSVFAIFGSRDANLLADEWESPVGATEELDGYLNDVVCVFWGVGRTRGLRGDKRGNFNCC